LNVITLPPSLDHRTVHDFLDDVWRAPDGKLLFDARHLRWIDPHGMVALLGGGSVAKERQQGPVWLQLPENQEVPGYLARMGFFAEAEGIFHMDHRPPNRSGGESDVLLEITPITTNSDVHAVVDRVQNRAGRVLSRTLGYPPTAVVQFSVILSEVCQNVIEHAAAPGWVAAQAYNWQKRLGRYVLVIAVSDLGRGFRGSLEGEHASRFGERWSDATALEAVFMHGATRFTDSGRGQGIQHIRKQVRRWNGIFWVRSGTARIADVPEWDDTPQRTEGLSPFPGAHIGIILPAVAPNGDAEERR
jgi:anti-sigma regulatory factor (Ser/Thr protein kinase)